MSAARTFVAVVLARAAVIGGASAALAELIVGRSRWIGNKDDPTTLGWVTFGITLSIAIAAIVASRRGTAVARLATGAAMIVSAGLGFTTAGLAWSPAGIAALVAGTIHVNAARHQRSLRVLIADAWTTVLLIVLASIYLTFGIVAGGLGAAAGVGGGAAVGVAVAIRRRSRRAAGLLLIVGVAPFAVMAAWTAVIPLTAVLLVGIGVPTLCSAPASPEVTA